MSEVIVAALAKADGGTLPGSKVNRATAGRDKHLVPKALDYLKIGGRVKVEDIEYRGHAGTRVTLIDDDDEQTE